MSAVLVSGANRGLGSFIALGFARAGHHVFAGARNPGDATDLQRLAADEGLTIDVVTLDVTAPESVAEAIALAAETAGTLDILVSNAGVAVAGPIELVDDDEIRSVFEVNTFGTLRLIRAALPVMRAQGSGTIIAVGSLSGRIPAPGMGVYAASKQAVSAALEALAFEVEQFGIRVSCIEPGPYRTQITGSTVRPPVASPYADLMGALGARTRRRIDESGDPAEVARAVVSEAFATRPRLHVPVGHHAVAALGDDSEAFSEGWLATLRRELAPEP